MIKDKKNINFACILHFKFNQVTIMINVHIEYRKYVIIKNSAQAKTICSSIFQLHEKLLCVINHMKNLINKLYFCQHPQSIENN